MRKFSQHMQKQRQGENKPNKHCMQTKIGGRETERERERERERENEWSGVPCFF